jgi:hypothetical protein
MSEASSDMAHGFGELLDTVQNDLTYRSLISTLAVTIVKTRRWDDYIPLIALCEHFHTDVTNAVELFAAYVKLRRLLRVQAISGQAQSDELNTHLLFVGATERRNERIALILAPRKEDILSLAPENANAENTFFDNDYSSDDDDVSTDGGVGSSNEGQQQHHDDESKKRIHNEDDDGDDSESSHKRVRLAQVFSPVSVTQQQRAVDDLPDDWDQSE